MFVESEAFKNLFATKKKQTFSIIKCLQNDDKKEPPEMPLTCCGSGCQNCVWIKYADDLLKYYAGNDAKSQEEIRKAIKQIEQIENETIRDFLIMELKMKLRTS
jgi:hypothetical protein